MTIKELKKQIAELPDDMEVNSELNISTNNSCDNSTSDGLTPEKCKDVFYTLLSNFLRG